MKLERLFNTTQHKATTILDVMENTIYAVRVHWLDSGIMDNVVMSRDEAISVAIAILKHTEILPEATTIEELEKQGKL